MRGCLRTGFPEPVHAEWTVVFLPLATARIHRRAASPDTHGYPASSMGCGSSALSVEPARDARIAFLSVIRIHCGDGRDPSLPNSLIHGHVAVPIRGDPRAVHRPCRCQRTSQMTGGPIVARVATVLERRDEEQFDQRTARRLADALKRRGVAEKVLQEALAEITQES